MRRHRKTVRICVAALVVIVSNWKLLSAVTQVIDGSKTQEVTVTLPNMIFVIAAAWVADRLVMRFFEYLDRQDRRDHDADPHHPVAA